MFKKIVADFDWGVLGGSTQIITILHRDVIEIYYNTTLHNVHFGKYVYLPTEQAETHLKSCVLINYSTYICLCLFGWKVNMILKETVTFKL